MLSPSSLAGHRSGGVPSFIYVQNVRTGRNEDVSLNDFVCRD